MVEDVAPDPGQPSIGEVRANNRFDLAPLEAWFRTNVEPPANVPPSARCWYWSTAPPVHDSPAEGLTWVKTLARSRVEISPVGSA